MYVCILYIYNKHMYIYIYIYIHISISGGPVRLPAQHPTHRAEAAGNPRHSNNSNNENDNTTTTTTTTNNNNNNDNTNNTNSNRNRNPNDIDSNDNATYRNPRGGREDVLLQVQRPRLREAREGPGGDKTGSALTASLRFLRFLTEFFLLGTPVKLLLYSQKCQGVHFSPICQNPLHLQRPH